MACPPWHQLTACCAAAVTLRRWPGEKQGHKPSRGLVPFFLRFPRAELVLLDEASGWGAGPGFPSGEGAGLACLRRGLEVTATGAERLVNQPWCVRRGG